MEAAPRGIYHQICSVDESTKDKKTRVEDAKMFWSDVRDKSVIHNWGSS